MRGSKGILGLVLLLAIALVASVPAGSAAGTSGDTAVAAKKKCKKKKKKCKKKKMTTAPISMVRATLTWSGGGDSTDYDLYVFDPSGGTGRAVSNPISNSSFSSNATGSSGSETFTDLNFGAHRPFDFGVCHQDGGNDGSTYSIDYVSASGVHFTDSQASPGDGYNARYSDSGGAPANNTFTCPAP